MGVFDYLIKPVRISACSIPGAVHPLPQFVTFSEGSRQTRRTLMRLFNIGPKNKPQRRIADCGELSKTPSTGYDKCSPTRRRRYIRQTLWRKFWAASKTTARRYLEQGVKNNFLEARISYGKVGEPETLSRQSMKLWPTCSITAHKAETPQPPTDENRPHPAPAPPARWRGANALQYPTTSTGGILPLRFHRHKAGFKSK